MRVVRGWIVAAAVTSLLRATAVASGASGDTPRIIDHLYGTAMVDANSAWAVGGFGTIVRSRDGGKSWQLQKSGSLENLFDVDFADTTHGWVVGRSGLIAYTSDSGDSWHAQASGTDQHLFSVKALSPQRAVAVGDWGTILSTKDSGKSWQAHVIDRDVILNAQAWPDAEHGWIIGEAGTVLVTSDGGNTWQDQPTGVDKTFFGTYFRDAQNGWVVGLDGIILRTVDGGATWQTQHGDTQLGALDQVGAKAGVENPSLYDISVAGQLGYAVGEGGAVFKSEDGGTTWQRASVPVAANLRWIRSVALVPGMHGMMVGANGLILRAADNQLSLPEP